MTTYHVISSTGGSVLPTSSQTGKDFQFSYDLDTHNGSYVVEVLCDGKKRGTYTVHVSRQTAQLFDLNQNILLGLPFFGDYIFNGSTYHLPVDYTNFIAAIQGFYGVTVGIDTAHGLFFKTGGLGQLPSDGKIPVLFAHSLTLEGIHDNSDGTFTYFDRMGNDTSISVCKLLGDGDCDLFVLKVDGANTTIKAGDTTPDIVTKRAKIQYVAGVPQLTDDFGTTVNLPLVEIHPSGISYDPVNNRWDIVQNDGTHLYVTWADMLADIDFVGGLVSAVGGNTLVVGGDGKLYAGYQSAVNISFSAIAGDVIHKAIGGTNVQEAIDDISTLLKIAETRNRAFSKVGSSQATNNDSINNSDAIYHSGNTILGGTSTPSATLQIEGTATEATDLATSKSQNALFIRPFLSSGWGLSFGSVSGRKQYLQAVSSGGTGVKELLLNPYGGNVGVGTDTPVGKQEITLNTGGISLRISRPTDSNFDIYQGAGITYLDVSNANAQLDFKIAGISAMRISNSRNVLIKKTADNGYGDLQVPRISLGYNTWHNSEDGVERMYFGQNSTTYLSAPTGFPITFKINGDYRYRFYNEGLLIYNDGIHDFTFAKSTIANSATSREFTFRKEASNQELRLFDSDGTTQTTWWRVLTSSNHIELANVLFAKHSTNVGIGTSTPDANTILDIVSNTKGSRPFPSMTQAQRTALTAPVGTHVYQTDGTEGVYVKKSTGWVFAY